MVTAISGRSSPFHVHAHAVDVTKGIYTLNGERVLVVDQIFARRQSNASFEYDLIVEHDGRVTDLTHRLTGDWAVSPDEKTWGNQGNNGQLLDLERHLEQRINFPARILMLKTPYSAFQPLPSSSETPSCDGSCTTEPLPRRMGISSWTVINRIYSE